MYKPSSSLYKASSVVAESLSQLNLKRGHRERERERETDDVVRNALLHASNDCSSVKRASLSGSNIFQCPETSLRRALSSDTSSFYSTHHMMRDYLFVVDCVMFVSSRVQS